MVLRKCRTDKCANLLLILRRGNDETRDLTLCGEREHPLMAGAIFANETGAVHTEEHWLVVLAGVVDDLVPSALQEG